MKVKECQHIKEARSASFVAKTECEECIKTQSTWLHLRLCLACGATLCCDDSPNQHASKHAANQEHPVIRSAELGETWLFCFSDNLFVPA
ncbi:MAG: UBP-type zinc finger domain-containing protein [Saprospiraceae bacterium]